LIRNAYLLFVIATAHFTINELRIKDAAHLSKLMLRNEARFKRDFPLTQAQNLTQASSEAYILRKKEENVAKSEFTWAIRNRIDDTVAGIIILKELNWEKGIGEFAYCIDLAFEGRGWITKAVQELTNFAFTALNLQTVQIIAHKTNSASIRVAQKCGFTWQKKLLKSYTPPDGEALDMELYERYADQH